jgi:hypothetical protein
MKEDHAPPCWLDHASHYADFWPAQQRSAVTGLTSGTGSRRDRGLGQDRANTPERREYSRTPALDCAGLAG